MHPIQDFFNKLHGQGLENLIQGGGYAVVAFIVFAETGLLAGFFLPGDSMLFVAGFLVGAGKLRPPHPLPQGPLAGLLLLDALLIVAAFAGNSTEYLVGSRA